MSQVVPTDKIDFKKALESYRAPRGKFQIIEMPDTQYLMIDGHGDPNSSSEYTDALSSLYPLAYKIKFASKHELDRDYVVPPLEGLWWAEDMDAFTVARDKPQWDWTIMLMVPEWIGQDIFTAAVAEASKKAAPPRIDQVRFESLSEGRCVQTLHVGPFDDEAPVLEKMHQKFIPDNDFRMSGKHHEIYLSDFRRAAPEKLRTILRQPIRET